MLTIAQWKVRLEDKVDGLRSMDEVMMARSCWDHGLSVHKAQKAIEDRRKGIVQ